jgi:hypothetical protein
MEQGPQKLVPTIYRAAEEDFTPAVQRIYCTPAMPSHLAQPVVGGTARAAR